MVSYTILSGIPRHELLEYFDCYSSDPSKQEESCLIYCLDNCTIQVGPTVRNKNSSFPIPSTEILFTGNEKDVTLCVKKFRTKFLRGGG